jgi:FG-GAP-like repeat
MEKLMICDVKTRSNLLGQNCGRTKKRNFLGVMMLSLAAFAGGLAGCGGEASDSNSIDSVTSALSGAPAGHMHMQRTSNQQNAAGVAGACTTPAHLTRYGGANATTVKVVPVFWGSSVNATTTSNIFTSLNVLQNSGEAAWLKAQYAMPQMLIQTPITITPHNTATALTDAAIQAELTYQVGHAGLPGAGSGFHYIVHFPSSVTVSNQCVLTAGGFCGYNGSLSGTSGTVYYSVIPDFASTACASNCFDSPATWYDALTRTDSHEIIEALTDEMGGGWQDHSQPSGCGEQIGDLCNGQAYSTEASHVGVATIQKEWSNVSNSCTGDTPGAANDVDGDGTGDFVLVGGPGWNTIPVGFHARPPSGDTFNPTNKAVANFPLWDTLGRTVMGDFDGNGQADLAVTGGAGWGSVPVAFSTGTIGNFNVTNKGISNFATWAATSGVLNPVAGDFNGDGRSDIAIAGGVSWTTIPLALSNGDGSFTVTNGANSAFENLIHNSTIVPTLLSGDFDGDGWTDLALVGGTSSNGTPWTTIPVAFSNGPAGTFRLVQKTVANFPIWATQHSYAVAGDFDGDGRADIALTSGPGWNTVPVAYSNGDGTFDVRNNTYSTFPTTAQASGAHVVAGDYDGDGTTELLLVGGTGWTTVTVLWFDASRNGSFGLSTIPDSWLATVASQSSSINALGASNAYKVGGP